MEELDLSTFYLVIIAALFAVIVILIYRLARVEDELKKLRQDTEAKQQGTSAVGASLVEAKAQGLESKNEVMASNVILDRIEALDKNWEARFKELEARMNASNEVEKLRQEIESRFNIRFDKETFAEKDISSFLFSMKNILYQLERQVESTEGDENLRGKAKGYIAILNLAMAWARQNKNDLIMREVTVLLPRAEAALKRTNVL